MARLTNAFGEYRIANKGLEQDYALLLDAYLELHHELDRITGRSAIGPLGRAS